MRHSDTPLMYQRRARQQKGQHQYTEQQTIHKGDNCVVPTVTTLERTNISVFVVCSTHPPFYRDSASLHVRSVEGAESILCIPFVLESDEREPRWVARHPHVADLSILGELVFQVTVRHGHAQLWALDIQLTFWQCAKVVGSLFLLCCVASRSWIQLAALNVLV